MGGDPGRRALIAHVVHRLAIGGLENGLVNLINRLPEERYRHAVICLTDYDSFRERITRADVPVHALHKRPGKDLRAYGRLWRLLRDLRPDLVHTRNVGTIDCIGPARAAGVRHVIHGEHGRDMGDLDGENVKQIWFRRLHAPFVDRFVPMSRDLERWLVSRVRISPGRIRQIYSGVDTERFHAAQGAREPLPVEGFAGPSQIVIGSVGRMSPVKDQTTLVRAFLELLDAVPDGRARLRLVHLGDGPLRARALDLLRSRDAERLAWLPGARSDVPDLLRALDVFVLPSLAEGISNTILEAMACGLPVVATRVGGNIELVSEPETGALVEPSNPQAMSAALASLVVSEEPRRRAGAAARARVERHFSLCAMVRAYDELYQSVLWPSSVRRGRDSSSDVGIST